jgi:hypothetical protein
MRGVTANRKIPLKFTKSQSEAEASARLGVNGRNAAGARGDQCFEGFASFWRAIEDEGIGVALFKAWRAVTTGLYSAPAR